MCYAKNMKQENADSKLRNLTLTQLAALQVILNSKNFAATSKYIGEHMVRGDGKSLASLNSLLKDETPLIKRMGKITARTGFVLAFNTEAYDPETARKSINSIIDNLVKAGLVEM